MQEIRNISIIGFGRVGRTLASFFQTSGFTVKQILYRGLKPTNALFDFVSNFKDLQPADLMLICTQDTEIAKVIAQLPKNQAIAYTSGSVTLESLGYQKNVAVFYPLQSFSNLSMNSIPEIPILIEAQDSVFRSRLIDFAKKYFNEVREMNSEQRKHLHLAAVIANNFTNHLIHLAENYCAEHQLDFNLLKPLIAETAKKWMTTSACQIQTGPAIRGDFDIIEQHKNELKDDMKCIYELLSESITKTHNIK